MAKGISLVFQAVNDTEAISSITESLRSIKPPSSAISLYERCYYREHETMPDELETPQHAVIALYQTLTLDQLQSELAKQSEK